MNTLTQQQQELARLRRMKPPVVVDPDKPVRRADPFKYERAEVYIRDGVLLDPNRKVLPRWKSTVYDGLFRMSFVSTEKGERIDFGDGPGEIVNSGGPFRCRVLASFLDNPGDGPVKRLDIGAVIEVPATKYCLIRSAELAYNTGGACSKRRYEPVPDDTPLRDGVLPSNFPSNMPKARKMAAQGLKKPEEDLSFAEIVRWFEKRKNGAETFGANGAK